MSSNKLRVKQYILLSLFSISVFCIFIHYCHTKTPLGVETPQSRIDKQHMNRSGKKYQNRKTKNVTETDKQVNGKRMLDRLIASAESPPKNAVMSEERRERAIQTAAIAKKIASYGKNAFPELAPTIIDEIIDKQEINASWEKETALVAKRQIEELDAQGVSIADIRCGETLCQLALAFDLEENRESFNDVQYFKHAHFGGALIGKEYGLKNGKHGLKVYFESKEHKNAFDEVAETILARLESGELAPSR